MDVRGFVRFAAVAAITGNPEFLDELGEALHYETTDSVLNSVMQAHIDEDGKVFRGGQPHGSLRKADLPAALTTFLEVHAIPLVQDLTSWCMGQATGNDGMIWAGVRAVVQRVHAAASIFGARDYFAKRMLEIIVLVGDGSLSDFRLGAADIDMAADLWPLGSGTKDGCRMIFPNATTDDLCRQGLKVLQRALGGGSREMTLVRVSAILCFFKRARSGKLPWPAGGATV